MPYSHTVRGVQDAFADLRTLLAKASPLRYGDQLAGLAASGAEERAIAQMTLADLPLSVFQDEAVVPYESDAITRLIVDTQDKAAFAPIAGLTVGEFRDWLLRRGHRRTHRGTCRRPDSRDGCGRRQTDARSGPYLRCAEDLRGHPVRTFVRS